MATVELRFTPLPAHVRTARLVAVSLARRAGIGEEVLDEVRLAVGEAATRAVGRHEAACPDEPVLVRLTDGGGRFVAEVVDRARDFVDAGAAPAAALEIADDATGELPAGVDLAVISGLVEDLSVEVGPQGSVVRMGWPVQAPAQQHEAVPAAHPGSGAEPAQ